MATDPDDLRDMLMMLTADWLNNDRTHAGKIADMYAHILAGLGPPTNKAVPYVWQPDAVQLSCTMGEWDGEPSAYDYEWRQDGVANGASGADYTVVEADAGHTLACVVTASNALGSTAAPMSNGVAIPAEP
jgi:hypothetical protein